MRSFSQLVPVPFTGVAIGWLVGMSVEGGTTQSVIIILLAITSTLAVFLSGIELVPNATPPKSNNLVGAVGQLLAMFRVDTPRAYGVMLLALGIVFGTGTGVYFRANQLLSPAQQNSPQESTLLFSQPGDMDDIVRLEAASGIDILRIAGQVDEPLVQRLCDVLGDRPEVLNQVIQDAVIPTWKEQASE